MFTKLHVCMFYTSVEPLTSGTRTFNDNKLFNIHELHKLLNDGNFVVVNNDVSKWSDATKEQRFIFTDKLAPEEGFADTYVMSHYGRSGNGVTNRKIMLSFSALDSAPVCKATYFNS